MIESLAISNVATYGTTPEMLAGFSKFNFLFGSNGTGKTTVSRVIADEDKFSGCSVNWRGGTRLQPMVYNYDFVEKNFNQLAELKGVFTLGEKQVDILAEIAKIKGEVTAATLKIENFTQQLDGTDGVVGKKGELATIETLLKDKCWTKKQKHDAKLQGAFEGYRGSSEKFKGKVLQELSANTASLLTLDELEKKAVSVFGVTPSVEDFVPIIEAAQLLMHESNVILKKRVIGKEDVDIAAMIKKLENSDWVRAGRIFYEANNDVCPFCQQDTGQEFAKSLNEYFDENFLNDSKEIEDIIANYATDAARIQQQLTLIISTQNKFLDIEKFKIEKNLFDSKITINNQRLALKKKEASQVVDLEPLGNVITEIQALIKMANILVLEHNNMVANISKERSDLTAQVWKYVIEELKSELASYNTTKNGLEKAITSISEKIEKEIEEKRNKSTALRALEKQTTSIQPTIDGINSLLLAFGFQGFTLSKAATGNAYKLVRQDGSDAKTTLSEGEKTFVTFLYFYHLLKGSESDSGMTADRVVVFDDPVSSLDSDILFIVGSLIKGLFDEVRAGTGHIKQIFILTHNVYFHKEITFNPKRRNNETMQSEETFWVVRKPDSISKIEKHTSNPIKTSYELLWSEVRRADRQSLTIQNTLRRILENYFKILGGVDPDKICAMFDGKEKFICKSLFSWVNDGSHFAQDDLYVSIDTSMIETYLQVFKAIFDKSKHDAHYKMMMGEAA